MSTEDSTPTPAPAPAGSGGPAAPTSTGPSLPTSDIGSYAQKGISPEAVEQRVPPAPTGPPQPPPE